MQASRAWRDSKQALIKRFLYEHSGFNRAEIQGYLNLYSFVLMLMIPNPMKTMNMPLNSLTARRSEVTWAILPRQTFSITKTFMQSS